MSSPTLPAATVPSPAGMDGMAWALAAVPLASAVLLAVFALSDAVDAMRALSALALVASAALVLADRRRLQRSGMAGGGMPSAWWFLLPPVYLWRRAAALGRSKAPVWGWGASTVLAGIVRVLVLAVIATQIATAGRLPDCASRDMAADIKAVFDSLPAAQQAGVRAVSLGGQAEVGQGPGSTPAERYCTGVMLASDNVEYAIDYSFERRQDEVIIRLQLGTGR